MGNPVEKRESRLCGEMVNTIDSKSVARKGLPVRLRPKAQSKTTGRFPGNEKSETMIDEQGIERHTWPAERVQRLYRDLENFIADLTRQEYRQFETDFAGVKTILHERMNNQAGNTATK